ncbi:NADH-quinone oxidoreductase subunit 5 family protein [Chromatium okenii]|uniref:Na+/H+ antiporter subunit A n=1 Tax=Chromatium okenii TaxID=61644 RepID=A0A2S7XR42_9GAMM|nr:proton-conducting transporter membrane subunit [Chromatium okenii]PQJ96190.1 Na+/H+ antiporter subunit A [Chromatium okenii]
MLLIALLILFPLLAGVTIFFAPTPDRRADFTRWAVYGLGATTVLLALLYFRAPPQFFTIGAWLSEILNSAFFIGGIAVSAYLLFACRRIKKREWWIPLLILIQTGLLLFAELAPAHPEVAQPFYVDSFSILIALIVGIVGGLICIHAIHYMNDDQTQHPQTADRRPAFFFMLFVFLSAMFGVVFANHLLWLFFFWEITTLCSFWLISYSGTEEAIRNGFRALGLNLVGGVAFAGAIVWLTFSAELHTWELDQLIAAGSTLALIPAALIAIAGLSKSAQLPFSSWLLGAMVAPTTVSALLHSSTMVKAGVFILIKLAPVFHNTAAGLLLAFVGGLTFLITSLAAVTQHNAKRVLAYSTIANLGLIVMCAGVGTANALWAAILLILFHAVAKALLFLGVGTTEHLIGSRDIEDMEGLVYRRPLLAGMLLVGILGMFLAPFGMLLGKYTSFQAFLTLDVLPLGGVLLAAILAFGSAPTLFFWSKWMGKLVAMPRRPQPVDMPLARDEAIALVALTVITYVACALFPLADWAFVQPYTDALAAAHLLPMTADQVSGETIALMTLMLAVLFLMPLWFWLRPPRFAVVSGYLSGANVDGSASYRGAMGATREVDSRGYYLTGFIQENVLMQRGLWGAMILLTLLLWSAS